MRSGPRRYRSADEDSARWTGLEFRDGDIVISTRSKHGTTWMQMICALLIFGRADLPGPLPHLSPWLDWRGEELGDVLDRLRAQRHRRFIKTHTPLDGIPIDGRATYLVVARDPLDAAVSLYHQGDNLDRDRMADLTGADRPDPDRGRPPLDGWLARWVDDDADPTEALDSLPGVVHHLTDAWARRAEPNVVLVRYADLLADLPAAMVRLADRLAIEVDSEVVPELATAAGFEAMASRAEELAPDPGGILRDRGAFFRRGAQGDGATAAGPEAVARYRDRLRELAPPDLVAWLDGDRTGA